LGGGGDGGGGGHGVHTLLGIGDDDCSPMPLSLSLSLSPFLPPSLVSPTPARLEVGVRAFLGCDSFPARYIEAVRRPMLYVHL
jgi:hypothetical protein